MPIKYYIIILQMNKIGEYIYANFNQKDIKEIENGKVRAVIMGHCGNGKTYLINNLCNTSHKVGHSESSLTRDIAF